MLGNSKVLGSSSVQPSIAISGSNVVTIYRKSLAVSSELYYRSGNIDSNGVLSLGIQTNVANNTSIHADHGETPSIALNNQGIVVEMHEANGHSNALWTHVGRLDTNNQQIIHWADHQDSQHEGRVPSVALAYYKQNNIVVATFISNSDSTTIYVMTGLIDLTKNQITWYNKSGTFTGGNPKVAVNNNGCIILAYEDQNGILTARSGSLNNTGQGINWNGDFTTINTDSNSGSPSVGISDDNVLVAAYQGLPITDSMITDYHYDFPIKTRYGTVNQSGVVTWGDELYGAGLGKKPVIATNGTVVVSVQETPDTVGITTSNDSQVLVASSTLRTIFTNRNAWMANYRNRTLRQLTIPGAHDAGMSMAQKCTNLADIHAVASTVTQTKNFDDMLLCGIRYFDVRPVWFQPQDVADSIDSVPYTGHFSDQAGGVGCLGMPIADMISQVECFCNQYACEEVIILKFSHYFLEVEKDNAINHIAVDNNDADSAKIFDPLKQKLINTLVSAFGDRLYRKPSTETRRLVDIPLNMIAQYSPKILVVFDNVHMDVLFPLNVDDSVQLSHNTNVRACIFTYGDYYVNDTTPPASKNDYDLVVFDHYSNTSDPKVMTSALAPSDLDHPGQIYQYNQTIYHTNSDLYLLSWTLTQQFTELITGSPSIKTLAAKANACLGDYTQGIIQNNQLASYMPNIIYVDFCDNFVTDICNFVNSCITVQH